MDRGDEKSRRGIHVIARARSPAPGWIDSRYRLRRRRVLRWVVSRVVARYGRLCVSNSRDAAARGRNATRQGDGGLNPASTTALQPQVTAARRELAQLERQH